MSSWSGREKAWRIGLKAALINAGKWAEFLGVKNALKVQILKVGKYSTKFAADKCAWREAAKNYADIFNEDEFNRKYKEEVRIKRMEKDARFPVGRPRKAPVNEATRPARDQPEVVVEDQSETDILRDTKWVYDNMAKLIKTTPSTGVQRLDEATLKLAPSNGAIGLARYAMTDAKAFFEKFVTKILPKEDNAPPARTPEEIRTELDPTFTDLERYMKKESKRHDTKQGPEDREVQQRKRGPEPEQAPEKCPADPPADWNDRDRKGPTLPQEPGDSEARDGEEADWIEESGSSEGEESEEG